MSEQLEQVSFTAMCDGTAEDYLLLQRCERPFMNATGERVLAYLEGMQDSFPGYQITRLEHALQTASRALCDGACKQMVVAALLHDIGDGLAPENHSDLAASILRPYVSEKIWWIIKHHGVFQLYYYGHHIGQDRNARDRYRNHPWFDDCARFCEDWDQASFDPKYQSLPMETFRPMVLEVFRQPWAALEGS
ncbi:MAG: HD domain-containing protein [Pseudomonadota bacterium]